MQSTTLDPITEALGRLESRLGPESVLLNAIGEHLETSRCRDHWQLFCHAVLVRADGWTLGCSRDLYDAAKGLFPRDWLAVICYANTPHRTVIHFPRAA